VFSKIDLCSWYHPIWAREEDVHKTTCNSVLKDRSIFLVSPNLGNGVRCTQNYLQDAGEVCVFNFFMMPWPFLYQQSTSIPINNEYSVSALFVKVCHWNYWLAINFMPKERMCYFGTENCQF